MRREAVARAARERSEQERECHRRHMTDSYLSAGALNKQKPCQLTERSSHSATQCRRFPLGTGLGGGVRQARFGFAARSCDQHKHAFCMSTDNSYVRVLANSVVASCTAS